MYQLQPRFSITTLFLDNLFLLNLSNLTYGAHRMTCGTRLTSDLPFQLGQQRLLTSQLTMHINPKPSLWIYNMLTYIFCALSQLIKFLKHFFI
jgi:hypothetical protein